MFKEKRKKNTQKSDCWDRISEIADRDVPHHLSDQADTMCENPWPGPVDSYDPWPEPIDTYEGERDI